MLTVGIAIMLVSVLFGVVVLTSVAWMYSPARDVGRRLGTAMAISGSQQDAPYPAAGEQSAVADQEPPRWVLLLAILSAGGLVFGMLISMIASML